MTSRHLTLYIGLVCGAWLTIAPLLSSPRAAESEPAPARRQAPNFRLTDSSGKAVTLSALRGRVVLLDFWATWCTGCKAEIPWYIGFQHKYGAKGLTSVGAAMDAEGWTVVKPYLAQHPINYPIVVASAQMATQYGVANLPVTLLIDRKGQIADSHLGVVDRVMWEKQIQRLLAEHAK